VSEGSHSGASQPQPSCGSWVGGSAAADASLLQERRRPDGNRLVRHVLILIPEQGEIVRSGPGARCACGAARASERRRWACTGWRICCTRTGAAGPHRHAGHRTEPFLPPLHRASAARAGRVGGQAVDGRRLGGAGEVRGSRRWRVPAYELQEAVRELLRRDRTMYGAPLVNGGAAVPRAAGAPGDVPHPIPVEVWGGVQSGYRSGPIATLMRGTAKASAFPLLSPLLRLDIGPASAMPVV
jgi:hypothetical protein